MKYQKFLFFNVIGAAIWAGGSAYLGYFAGSYIEAAGINIEVAALAIVFISILPGIIHVLKDPKNRARIIRRIKRSLKRNR